MKRIRFTLGILVFMAIIPLAFTVNIQPRVTEFFGFGNGVLPDTVWADLDEILYFPSYVGEVEFPHFDHVEDFDLECVDCHHETNAQALSMPHDDYFEDLWIDCGLCHRGNGDAQLAPQACSSCHHSRTGDISDQTLSSKVVIHKNCWECHDSGTGVEASESCTDCHSGDKLSFQEPHPDSQENE